MGTADLNSTVVYCTRYSRFAVLENEDNMFWIGERIRRGDKTEYKLVRGHWECYEDAKDALQQIVGK